MLVYGQMHQKSIIIILNNSSFRWNYTRGAISGLLGSVIGETWHNFYENWKLL